VDHGEVRLLGQRTGTDADEFTAAGSEGKPEAALDLGQRQHAFAAQSILRTTMDGMIFVQGKEKSP
jgi:hypothetical protein